MKKTFFSRLGIILVFITGVLIMTYPFYINELNQVIDQKRMSLSLKKSEKEYEALREKWLEENERLKKSGLAPGSDPFNEEALESVSEAYYQEHLIGKVNIPDLALEIPLYDTTTNELLDRGATVLQGSSFPLGGEDTHAIITAHRGLPNRELFTNLPKLAKGDIFLLEVLDQELAYQVTGIKVVEPHETSTLTINEGQVLVTLVTCTPYMINTHRLLVTGERIPYTKKVEEKKNKGDSQRNWKKRTILISVFLFLIAAFLLLIREIRLYTLKSRRIELRIKLENENDEKNMTELALYDAKGKQAIMRKSRPYVEEIDLSGTAIFTNLPGAIYTLKWSEDWLIRVGIKNRKQQINIFEINNEAIEAYVVDGEIRIKFNEE